MKLSNYENSTTQRLNVKSLSLEINQTNKKTVFVNNTKGHPTIKADITKPFYIRL